MAIEKVRAYFAAHNMEERIQEFSVSSATVALAAEAFRCEPACIANTTAFHGKETCLLIVAAGDTKIDNAKFKQTFGVKATMLTFEEVEPTVGHAVGGVCPFAVNDGVRVYLDMSLKRFESVFPACGSSNSAIELTLSELETHAAPCGWVDVCKGWE